MIKAILGKSKEFLKSEDGPTTVEYAVMLALIIAVVMSVVGVLGGKTQQAFEDFGQEFDGAKGG